MKTLEKPIRLEPVINNPKMPQNRYFPTEMLGKGGMGVVFRGIDKVLNREVAIKKLMRKTAPGSLKKTAVLPREAKLLAKLNHPNIVTVHDVYQEQGSDSIFIVMELLNGKTLEEISRSGQFGMSQLAELVTQTQEALLAANEANLIHGDLKPQNIMSTELANGSIQYKLLDFDQARITGQENIPTETHRPSGSIYFMAPERFEGSPSSRASDTYAMGCIYYYMLTGQFPCQGQTTVEVMAAHLRGEMTPLSELRPDIPSWVGKWIKWVMTRDPKSRPQSPLAVHQSFQELIRRYGSVPEKLIGFPTQQKPAQNEQWYVARGNQVGGPHTWEAVQGFMQRGELHAEDMIKSNSMNQWEKLDTFTESTLQNAG